LSQHTKENKKVENKTNIIIIIRYKRLTVDILGKREHRKKFLLNLMPKQLNMHFPKFPVKKCLNYYNNEIYFSHILDKL